MMNSPDGSSRERGSILIFSLWILILITILSVAVGFRARQRLRFLQHLEVREKLREIASAGVAYGLDILTREGGSVTGLSSPLAHNPAVFRGIEIGEGLCSLRYDSPVFKKTRYGMIDETSKVDVNLAKIPTLARLFQAAADLSSMEASNLAASIVDFRDADESSNAGGAESRYYSGQTPPYKSKNSKIDTLEELLVVKGMTPAIYSKIKPYVTVHGSHQFNLNTAPGEVLVAMGMNDALAKAIDDFRAGRDKIYGNRDDRMFYDTQDVVEDLSGAVRMGDHEIASLEDFLESGVINLMPHTFSVQSVVHLKGRREVILTACIVTIKRGVRACSEQFLQLEKPPLGESD